MEGNKLNLKPGKWLVADCGKMPSESNCQLVMMAPVDQKEHLEKAGIDHMVSHHGHQREEAERLMETEGDKMYEEVEI